MKLFILSIIFLSSTFTNLSAQETDEDLIKATIEMYFEGWMTGDTLLVGKAMHSSCHLKIFKDAEVLIIDRNSYLSRFKPKEKVDGLYGRIINIDITGSIAAAKCELETPSRIFTDYFNMMKVDEVWYIVDKISTNIANEKVDKN